MESIFHFFPWQVGAGDLVHDHQGWKEGQHQAQVPGHTFDLGLESQVHAQEHRHSSRQVDYQFTYQMTELEASHP